MEGPSAVAEQYTAESLSMIHHALRASRRRLVVGLVVHRAISGKTHHHDENIVGTEPTQQGCVVTVRRLAKEIVSIEEGISVAHATGDSYHNVYTALIQTHLPELDDIGAIDYDADRKNVSPANNLIPLAMVAAISSPIAQMLFHDAVADIYSGSPSELQNSTGD